jgi:ABC-type transporter Mla maintaining outer membrane lipid asymmetry permease subunit MlaE
VLKARLLRLFALVFAFVGVILFVVLYFQNIEGSFWSALTNPFVVTILVVPFLPAAVLSFMASRLERQYLDKYARKD